MSLPVAWCIRNEIKHPHGGQQATVQHICSHISVHAACDIHLDLQKYHKADYIKNECGETDWDEYEEEAIIYQVGLNACVK
jgi:hypothetical protein